SIFTVIWNTVISWKGLVKNPNCSESEVNIGGTLIIMKRCSYNGIVPIDTYTATKLIKLRPIRSDQFGLLRPASGSVEEDICSTLVQRCSIITIKGTSNNVISRN